MAQNLYRKIRPTNWSEVVGNKANIQQLQNFVNNEERPHTYLFVGDSGCGKTTIARIFAKELGANDLSIHEIDCADTRGIDAARAIKEQMRYKQIGGKTVYIIDEVHKATVDWQNAMLKALEDTPSHVYFLLCTTDPQKLIKTVKTRCTEIRVSSVDEKELFKYLIHVNKNENFGIEKSVLKHIANHAGGSIRKALVLLEQIEKIEEVESQLEIVKSTVGDVEEQEVIELCRALLRGSWSQSKKILVELRAQKVDSEKIRYAVLGYMTSVVLKSGDSRAAFALECFSENTYDSKISGIVLAAYQVCNE